MSKYWGKVKVGVLAREVKQCLPFIPRVTENRVLKLSLDRDVIVSHALTAYGINISAFVEFFSTSTQSVKMNINVGE